MDGFQGPGNPPGILYKISVIFIVCIFGVRGFVAFVKFSNWLLDPKMLKGLIL